MDPVEFQQNLDDTMISEAIARAESQTSGEIRVFVSERELKPHEDVVRRATERFQKLGMTRTRERNAVLLYFNPRAQRFAIIGDEGIHRVCGQAFWDEVAREIATRLREHHFTEAVVHAIAKTGAVLARSFPIQPGDKNELSNEVGRE